MKLSLKRALPSLAAALLAASPLFVNAQQGVTDTEILIGEIAPLTGPASVGSVALSLGTKMAVAEVNAAGGINGRKIRVISEDDGYVVTRAVQAARKLITSDKVFALAAISGSAPSVALLPMLKETGIPTLNVLSFPETLHTPVVPNIYVGGASHQDSVEALATELNKLFPNKKWAVVTQRRLQDGLPPWPERFLSRDAVRYQSRRRDTAGWRHRDREHRHVERA